MALVLEDVVSRCQAAIAEHTPALAQTVDELGPVSILVNNAGGVFESALLDTTPNGWDALLRSILGHVLLCTQRVGRAMVEGGDGAKRLRACGSSWAGARGAARRDRGP